MHSEYIAALVAKEGLNVRCGHNVFADCCVCITVITLQNNMPSGVWIPLVAASVALVAWGMTLGVCCGVWHGTLAAVGVVDADVGPPWIGHVF